MASFKSHPFYSSLLAVCGVAVVAGAYLIVPLPLPFNLYRERNTALAKLAATQEDYKKFQNTTATPVTPNSENQKAIEADLKQTTEVLAATRDALTGKGGLAEKNRAEPVPADSSAAFFKIGLFRKEKFEKFHNATLDSPAEEEAAPAGKDEEEVKKAPPAPKTIRFRDDEWFGFSAYQHSGPSNPEIIRQVFQQLQIADYLLDALLESKPVEFVSLQREYPLLKADRMERDRIADEAKSKGVPAPVFRPSSQSPDDAKDYFDLDPTVSARKTNFVETTGFQLTFIGKSETLRRLLNKLAAFELPIIVRQVEVVPDTEAPPPPAPPPQLDDEGVPIVTKPLKLLVPTLYSRFVVTVEYIDLVAKPQPTTSPSP